MAGTAASGRGGRREAGVAASGRGGGERQEWAAGFLLSVAAWTLQRSWTSTCVRTTSPKPRRSRMRSRRPAGRRALGAPNTANPVRMHRSVRRFAAPVYLLRQRSVARCDPATRTCRHALTTHQSADPPQGPRLEPPAPVSHPDLALPPRPAPWTLSAALQAIPGHVQRYAAALVPRPHGRPTRYYGEQCSPTSS